MTISAAQKYARLITHTGAADDETVVSELIYLPKNAQILLVLDISAVANAPLLTPFMRFVSDVVYEDTDVRVWTAAGTQGAVGTYFYCFGSRFDPTDAWTDNTETLKLVLPERLIIGTVASAVPTATADYTLDLYRLGEH